MEFNVDLGSLRESFNAIENGFTEQTRPAAQAMAQVFYDDIRSNLAGRQNTGTLYKAIYQFYMDDVSDDTNANYRISWRTAGKGLGLAVAPHGHLVEFGYIQRYARYKNSHGDWVTDKRRPLDEPRYVRAHPFIRPALDKTDAAQDAGEAILFARFDND